MSKRNIILIIIILAIVLVTIFGFVYFSQPTNQNGTTEGTNFLSNFLPFGKSKNITPQDTSPTDISGYIPTEDNSAITNTKFKKISSFPIAGFGVFMKERFKEENNLEALPPSRGNVSVLPITPSTEFAPAIRYVNKTNGNIYQTFADKIDERRFSEIVVPKVYEAYFGNKGESVIMRYLKEDGKTIETYVGALQKEYLGADSIGTSEVKGSFLPENISDMSVSSDSSKMFYLFNIGDNSAGISYTLQSSTKVQIFDSAFTEWLSFWPKSDMLTVTTKPSANVPGYMYVINPDRKDFNKVLGGINGLTTLTSPDGKNVLYSDNNLSLNIFNTETKESNYLGMKTLAEKCVWAPTSDAVYCAIPKYINSGSYPDSWYQGEVSFSDEIWKIDIKSGSTILVLDPNNISNGEEIDGIRLTLDESQNFLFLINKKDSYLWGLNLK